MRGFLCLLLNPVSFLGLVSCAADVPEVPTEVPSEVPRTEVPLAQGDTAETDTTETDTMTSDNNTVPPVDGGTDDTSYKYDGRYKAYFPGKTEEEKEVLAEELKSKLTGATPIKALPTGNKPEETQTAGQTGQTGAQDSIEDKKIDGNGATNGATRVEVNGDVAVKMDHLGPIVINEDGTMARITNWHDMTPMEQKVTQKRLLKRNAERLKVLREKEAKAEEEAANAEKQGGSGEKEDL